MGTPVATASSRGNACVRSNKFKISEIEEE